MLLWAYSQSHQGPQSIRICFTESIKVRLSRPVKLFLSILDEGFHSRVAQREQRYISQNYHVSNL